jgi:hypothetical protein
MIKKFTEYKNSYSKELIINENLQKARSILKKNKMPETNTDFQELRKLLVSNPGYLGKFTDWLVNDKISYNRLVDLYTQIKDKRLPKAIDEFKTPEEVIDTIIRSTSDTAVNQMIHAIPSKAREFLRFHSSGYCDECDEQRFIECPDCYGNGTHECDKCEGNGEMTCTDCHGNGSKKCNKCKGRGTYYRKECPDCNGNGEIECKTCEGDDAPECDKCKGDGRIDCTTCKDGQQIKCPACNSGKETPEWKEFVKFLSLQAPNKELICDFFSKKGGRYSAEDGEWDWDVYPLEELTEILTRLIDIPSIDAIIERLPTEENLKLIHNDENVLIVACNYEGIQKYGSSYWCIHQDESTFDDYVYSNSGTVIEQWIVYIKGKMPLVDERSVMGITYNIDDNEILNAHWEDDDECYSDAKRILKRIKLDRNLILNALDIYNYDDSVKLKYPEIFLTTLEKMFIKTKEAIESTTKLKKGRSRHPDLYTIMDSIEYFYDNEGKWTKKLTDAIISLCKKYQIKIPVESKSDLGLVIFSRLWGYVDFIWTSGGENIFNIFNDDHCDGLSDKDRFNIIKWLVDNGYKIEEYIDGRYAQDYLVPLFKMNLVSLEKLIDSGADIDDIDDIDVNKKIAEYTFNNIEKYRGNRLTSLLENILYVIEKDNNFLIKYKQVLLDVINSGKVFSKSNIESILDKVDDDDIEMACARKLFHRKIISKYDVEMKKKMLERLVSYKDFKTI